MDSSAREGAADFERLCVWGGQAFAEAQRLYAGVSPKRHAAYANAVAYAVTGWSGGYGGPSVREHAAARVTAGRRLTPEQARQELAAPDGVIFGPLADMHRLVWRDEHCQDDDPADLDALTSSR